MKPIANKISPELIEGFKDFKAIQEEAILRINKSLSENLKDQIIFALARHGFLFDTRREFELFCASDRCEMQIKDNIKTLLVDNKPICQWDPTPKTENNFTDKTHSIKVEYNFFRIL